MKKLFSIIALITALSSSAQKLDINYEWFSLGGGFLYSIEDEYLGLNGKINLPLGSHAKFVMQGTLFPEQMQFTDEGYNEIRAKFNVEFTPIKFKKLYLTVQTGFDYGGWQRTFFVEGSTLGEEWKRDESMMFGGILNYDFHRFRLYADYMYMPQIFSNHVGLGIAVLFFEDKTYRRRYMQRRLVNSNTGWKVRNKGGNTRSKKSKNKG